MTMRRRTATSGGHATIRRYTRRPERAPRAELPLSGVFRYTCLTSLSLKVVADYDDVAGPSDWHRTPGPACVGARGVPGEVGARMQSVHARGVEGGGKTLRCAHDKTVANRQPRIFTSFWECYRRSLRSVFTYLSVTLAGRTPRRARAVRLRGRGRARRPPAGPAALRRRARANQTRRSRTRRRSGDSAGWTRSRPTDC